ncbi:hypothetical protein KM1_196140 [Entamoeba histolytica HM-3:IMSS]|uniref:Uncharacterized protein n=1 Tax=Entamoeba histolytica HM-3:IMSS TaxID=885315 RepID=M7VYC0_ENTHI|nr:hypothetical protein KM1_196140 [Entamoeba histolytica HM-3:IMSS]
MEKNEIINQNIIMVMNNKRNPQKKK